MKYLFIILLLALSQTGKAQDIASLLNFDTWVNTGGFNPLASAKGKPVVVYKANPENLESLEIIRMFNKLQNANPYISIFIVLEPLDNSIDSTDSAHLLKSLDIGLPAAILPPASEPILIQTASFYFEDQAQIVHLNPDSFSLLDSLIKSEIKDLDKTGLLPFYYKPSNKPQPILSYPFDLVYDSDGKRFFLSDYIKNQVIEVSITGEVDEVIGTGDEGNINGTYTESELNGPRGLAYDPENQTLYVADSRNFQIKQIDLTNKKVKTILGNGAFSPIPQYKIVDTTSALGLPIDLEMYGNNLLISTSNGIWELNTATLVAEKLVDSEKIIGITTDTSGEFYYSRSMPSTINRASKKPEIIFNSEGDFGDIEDCTSMVYPFGLKWTERGIYVCDTYGNRIGLLSGRKNRYKCISMETSEPIYTLNSEIIEDELFITDGINGAIYKCDPSGGKARLFNFSNYQKLMLSRVEEPVRIFDGDTLVLKDSEGMLTISLELPPEYKRDPAGLSNASLSSGTTALNIVNGNPEEGFITIEYKWTENENLPMDLILDFSLSLLDNTGVQRQVAFAVNFPLISGQTPKTQAVFAPAF